MRCRSANMSCSIKITILLLFIMLDDAAGITTDTPCPLEIAALQKCTVCDYVPDSGWQINCADSGLTFFPNITTQDPIDILNLDSNSITYIDPKQVRALQIRELRLRGNSLTSTEFLSSNGTFDNSLGYLDLSGNLGLQPQGVVRSSHFKSLSNLAYLDVSSIGLTDINFLKNEDDNEHLGTLEIVVASNNDFSGTAGIHRDTFHGKTRLVKIDARDSRISDLRFLDEPSLRSLKNLKLQRNEINMLLVSDIRELVSLTELNIRQNLLTSLSRAVLDNLPAIKVFDWALNDNVVCNCSIGWLRQWLVDHPNIMTYPRELDACGLVSGTAVCSASAAPTSTTPVSAAPTSTTPVSAKPTSTTPVSPTDSTSLFPATDTTTPIPTALPLSTIIIIAVVIVVVILGIVVTVAVCLCKRRGGGSLPDSEDQKGNSRSNGLTRISVRSNDSRHAYEYIDRSNEISRAPEGRADGKSTMADRPLPSNPAPVSTSSDPQITSIYLSSPVTSMERQDSKGYLMPISQSRNPAKSEPEDGSYVDFDPEEAQTDRVYQSLRPVNSMRIYTDIPLSPVQKANEEETGDGKDNAA